jgi:hypothetical protein
MVEASPEPAEEGDELLPREGCEGRIVLEVAAQLPKRRPVIQDCVGALSGSLLVVDEAFEGLG